MLLQFVKFGITGLIGLFVDFSVTWLLRERIKINQYVANSVGFMLAASSNYYINRVWTFQSDSDTYVIQFTSFLIISIIGLLINNGIIYALRRKFMLHFYLAKLIAIAVVVIWNFLANYYITFALF